MEAVLGLDQVAHLSRGQRERGLLELGHHAPAAEVIQVSAVHLRARVLGERHRELRKIGAGLDLGEQAFRLRAHDRLVLAAGVEQDVARAHLLRRLELLDVVVVVALHVGLRHHHRLPRLVAIEQQVRDLALFADTVLRLAQLEKRGDVGIGDHDVASELVGGQRDHLQLHLLVARAVLALEIRIRDRHPVGDRGAQLVDDHAAPQRLLELGLGHRRVLRLQQLLVARFADELSVLLQPGDREDLPRQLLVADREAVTIRLDERHLLVDHLRENLLVDPELAQQLAVQAAAELRGVVLHLLDIALLELARGQLVSVDLRDHLARRRAERLGRLQKVLRDEESNERQHNGAKAPFEPGLVPAHPVEHGHAVNTSEKPSIVPRRPGRHGIVVQLEGLSGPQCLPERLSGVP